MWLMLRYALFPGGREMVIETEWMNSRNMTSNTCSLISSAVQYLMLSNMLALASASQLGISKSVTDYEKEYID